MNTYPQTTDPQEEEKEGNIFSEAFDATFGMFDEDIDEEMQRTQEPSVNGMPN